MKVAVLSGKGGAGKTMVAVNLAAAAPAATYIDCDVEEPNGRLFFRPQQVQTQPVETFLPAFDVQRCSGCRKCVDVCRFHALAYLKNTPRVFSDVCHACGACQLVCPEGAVELKPRPVGCIEQGQSGSVAIVSGILNLGEASGVPVIRAALQAAPQDAPLTVIDCPPGSACSVMESVRQADYCLLVAEPTAFGLHNLQMVHELLTLLKKPCGVIVNKVEQPWPPLEDFCQNAGLPVLLRIPYQAQTARRLADGEVLSWTTDSARQMFAGLLEQIGGAIQ